MVFGIALVAVFPVPVVLGCVLLVSSCVFEDFPLFGALFQDFLVDFLCFSNRRYLQLI